MTQAERLAELRRIAWDIRDLDLFEFYNRLENDLKRLRAVGRAVKYLHDNGGSGATWDALFEALFDADGLLTPDDVEGE